MNSADHIGTAIDDPRCPHWTRHKRTGADPTLSQSVSSSDRSSICLPSAPLNIPIHFFPSTLPSSHLESPQWPKYRRAESQEISDVFGLEGKTDHADHLVDAIFIDGHCQPDIHARLATKAVFSLTRRRMSSTDAFICRSARFWPGSIWRKITSVPASLSRTIIS